MGTPKMFEDVTFMQNTDTLRSQILLIMIYWFYHRISMTYHFFSQTVCKPVITLVLGKICNPLVSSLVNFFTFLKFCTYPRRLGHGHIQYFFSHSTIIHEASTKAGQTFKHLRLV